MRPELRVVPMRSRDPEAHQGPMISRREKFILGGLWLAFIFIAVAVEWWPEKGPVSVIGQKVKVVREGLPELTGYCVGRAQMKSGRLLLAVSPDLDNEAEAEWVNQTDVLRLSGAPTVPEDGTFQ